jgi:predicted  nucleic acid-binding Zn-ribbon protein
VELGKEILILDSLSANPVGDIFGSGVTPGMGTFFCLDCGSQLSLRETDHLPGCPNCGGSRFRRDSIFAARQEHDSLTTELSIPEAHALPEWLAEARRMLSGTGHFLVYRDDEGPVATFPIERGWTRIGRSANADLCLDDPSVSRRHALIVAEPGKQLRVLDDRSLNSVFVNGEPVEWARLHDADELAIGRFRLYALRS